MYSVSMLMELYILGLYVFTCITLHGGPEKGQKWGRPLRVLSHFCFLYFCGIYSEYLSFCCTFKLVLHPGRFSYLFRLVLFTVHVRPVLSPCQASYTIHIHHTCI